MSYNPQNPNGQATSANSAPVVVASDQSAIPVSGSVTANAGTNLNTSALALDATLTGGTQKSKLVDSGGSNVATISAGGALKVDGSAVTQPVSGTVSVSGVAQDSSVTGLQVSQGSTTSGQKGDLVQGAVTTSAPTYTTAQTSPLSLDTSGNLRVANTPSGTQTVSGTVAATQSGTWTVQPGNTANTTAWKVDGSAVTQPVSGTVTANAGTNLNTSALALESGGNLAAIKTDTDTLAGAVSSSKVNVNISSGAIPSGTNAIGTVNISPTASGGWTAYFANAITTTVTVSGAAGKFGGYMLINLNSAPAYLQVFDTTSSVTLGTTAPTFVIPIPANSTGANGLAANLELANGVAIANGIKTAATTTANGSTTVSTGLSGSIWYK